MDETGKEGKRMGREINRIVWKEENGRRGRKGKN